MKKLTAEEKTVVQVLYALLRNLFGEKMTFEWLLLIKLMVSFTSFFKKTKLKIAFHSSGVRKPSYSFGWRLGWVGWVAGKTV